MERWHNKIAVITGASSGIGEACCRALLENGMIVVGLARRYERMEDPFKAKLPQDQKNRFYAIKCDVTREKHIVDAFRYVEIRFGGIDVLINNACITRLTQIVSKDNTKDLKDILDVNVLAPAICAREAFRSMKRRGVDGHVIMLNSIAGHRVAKVPGRSFNMYPPSKYAITAMTEVLRHEFILNETKVKVTSISPGLVDTEAIEKGAYPSNAPMLKAEDIADAIVYCLQTPPHVQIHEIIIKPVGEMF